MSQMSEDADGAASPEQRERLARLLLGTRFAVRWVRSTGSTNADVMEAARQGEPEGLVVLADHQSAGRGRRQRTWTAPPRASLLFSVLLRPPASVVGATTMAAAVAAAAAVEAVAGLRPAVKWPNDLVVETPGADPGAGGTGGGARKLAGILAEAEWPAGSAGSDGWRPPRPEDTMAVVIGVGLNVNWPPELPPELQGVATAINHEVGHDVDRLELLAVLLRGLERCYEDLLAGASRAEAVVDEWRRRSATLGRRVRVDLGHDEVEGKAVDLTPEGHLVVETASGRRTLAVGDVVHLRPAP